MIFPKNKRIELCVGRHHTQVYLDAEHKRLVATNGNMVVSLPVETHGDDVSGPISPAAIKLARKLAKGDQVVIKATSDTLRTIDGATMPRDLSGFPPYEKVLTDYKEGVTISLDAKMLYDLSQALGADRKLAGVTLTFPEGTSARLPIQVALYEPDGGRAVLMPLGAKSDKT